METIEKSENKFVFKANVVDSLANAIRRYINHTPILAVDELEIKKNGSALYDETIAHRLGLVPLKNKKDISEKGLKITLAANKEGIVESGELKGAEPVFEKIPIAILDKGQELEITATAKLGKGTEHAKFSPGAMFYRNCCEITTDKSLAQEIKKFCPTAEVKEKSDKIIIVDDKKQEISDICEGIIQKNKKEFENNSTDELVISLESWGQIPVKEIFLESIKNLKKDFAELGKKLK